jgi:hypothetical protein
MIPGKGIVIEQDKNGVCYISTEGGYSVSDLVAGDNIDIQYTEDGKVVVSAVNTVADIAAGQNVSIDIDPETGTAIINAIIGGATSEHYKGVFDTPQDLIAADPDPEVGDYGMVKDIVVENGDTSWTGRYKYCFFINGQWTVIDQMLTFTSDAELLQQFYSVGGSSPVIYLHIVARTGNFWDLNNVPIVATPVVTVEGDTVTAECATEGAEIWYTTDGSMPHVNGTKYAGQIVVNSATSFRFVGIKNGMINSLEAVASVDYSLESPVIDLDWTNGEISIENPNAGGTVYYTTDGSEPTNASTEYTEPFASGDVASVTVKAVVYDNGTYSVVSAKTYTRSGGVVSQSTDYTSGQMGFRARCTQDSGMVKYTTDGSDPDYTSQSLSGWLYYPMFVPTSYKWRTYAPGYLPGSVSTFSGGYAKPTAPTFVFDAETNTVTLGKTGNCQLIDLKTTAISPNYGCRIYYTLDGTTPTAASTLYTGPFHISGNVTVKAVLIAYGQYSSDVTTENIVITDAPTISLNSDTGDITITGPAGSTLYYTRDGSDPTTESTQYTGPFNVENSRSITVKAIAVTNGQESAVAEETYPGLLLQWRGSAGGDIDYSIGKITKTPRTPADGATVFYDVSASGYPGTWKPYDGKPVEIDLFDGSNPREFLFRQTKPGWIPAWYGGVRVGYTAPDAPEIVYDEVSGMVTLALGGNTAYIPLQTNNNVPTMGARIYYTTDGSIPTAENGIIWTGEPFGIREDCIIKAVCVCYGTFSSDVSEKDVLTPLCFYCPEDCIITLYNSDDAVKVSLEYSKDGRSWSDWGGPEYRYDRTLSLNAGERVFIRNKSEISTGFSVEEGTYKFRFTSPAYASGNINSLLCKNHYSAVLTPYCFKYLFDGCQNLITPPKMPSFDLAEGCYYGTFYYCTNLVEATKLPAITLAAGCYGYIYYGCRFLMSDDASTFNFTFGATLPQTVGGVTYNNPRDIAAWMGNLCGFDYMVPESALADDVVARIFKDNETGVLKYFPQSTYDAGKFFADQYTEKDWMRQERNRDGITVVQRKTGIAAAKYAEDNRYKLYCDTTANGGFTIETGSWGSVNTQTIAWNAGDTLDDIVALLTSDSYVRFSHVQGEDFIRVLASQSSSSYDCTLSNNTGGTVVDLSKQCRVGGVAQAETHRVWQGTNLHTMFPDAGIPDANTVQYSKSGLNLSYRCGGNLTTYMNYYEVSGSGHGGVDTYLAEDTVSARMSRVGFASCNGSGNPDAQALYDKYDGSWEAYMEASMIDGESTNANGIVDQTYSVADTVSPFLASVETADFTGEWIPVFPIFYNAYQVVDADFGHGIVGANHDISVYMDVDTMTQLNAGGCNISRTSYYWSVAQYYAYYGWVFHGEYGTVSNFSKSYGGIGARVLAYIRPS